MTAHAGALEPSHYCQYKNVLAPSHIPDVALVVHSALGEGNGDRAHAGDHALACDRLAHLIWRLHGPEVVHNA